MRVTGVLACLMVTASAGAEPADHDACERVAPRGQLARYDLLGDGAIHAVARTGEHYVVYPHGGADGGCELYALNAAVSRVEGQLGFGTQAYAMRARACSGEACPTIVAFRGKSARALRVLRTGLDCDEAAELRRIKLFPRRDVVELICRRSAGAGSIETVVLYDATADAIEPLFQLETGSYEAAAPGEACARVPVGSLRVEKPGVLRVIDPKDGELIDGKATLPARQLLYDPVKRQFAPSAAPAIPTRVNSAKCPTGTNRHA